MATVKMPSYWLPKLRRSFAIHFVWDLRPKNIVIVAGLNELKLSFCLTVLEYTKTAIHQSGGG